MSTSSGAFVWYELLAEDAAAAERFYGAVVGWSIQDAGLSDRRYAMLMAGGVPVGGMMALTPDMAPARPGWTGYIAVDDVDGFAARIETAGGGVHRAPQDIPGVGRFCVVSDPGGAVFILFTPTGEAPPPLAPTAPGNIGWRELHAADGTQAFAFYSDLFGWEKGDAIPMGAMGTYQLFTKGGVQLGGMMTKMNPAQRAAWLYYFNVDSIEPAAERVKSNGGQVINGPHAVPGGSWIVQCLDPHGVMFALVSPAAV